MPTAYKTVIYPGIGKTGGIQLAAVKDITSELNKAVVHYLQQEKIHDPQGIRLPGLVKARDMITKANKDAGKNPLTVRGGINTRGELVVSVNGILPPEKPGGKPVAYDVATVVRPGFAELVTTMKTEANVVANIHPTADATIDRAAKKQAAKYTGSAANVQTEASLDVGAVTTGTIVLAAHGGAMVASGTVYGKTLGRKTPKQIVDLLTTNADPKKRLSPKFTGTVLLSGCFTAAGTPPPDYNYSIFAQEVKRLLAAEGYKNAVVRGMPGPSVTKESGDKAARHAMATAEGAKALKQQLDELERKLQEVVRAHGNDRAAILADPRFKTLAAQFQRVKRERADVLNAQDEAGKAAARIDGLFGTFGLRVR